MFSKVMSTRLLQRAILKRNLFVERILPSGINRKLSAEELDHYRRVQPTPQDRIGVAELPKQIITATPFLVALERDVTTKLADQRVLITYPMRDPEFPAKTALPRMREIFSDAEIRELPAAKHFFLEDAPQEVAAAILERFA
jgi:haloalkane dehalogenase